MSILNHMPVRLIEICNLPEIIIGKNYEDSQFYIDFNTGMKSHFHLYYIDGKYVAKGRYGREEAIEDCLDFYFFLKGCMCGRDFMNDQWVEIYNNGFGEFENEKIGGE